MKPAAVVIVWHSVRPAWANLYVEIAVAGDAFPGLIDWEIIPVLP